MITTIRKRLTGQATKIVIYIVSIGMLGLFSLPMVIKQSATPWAFKVNGHAVKQIDYDNEVNEIREKIAQFRSQYGQFADYLLQSMGMSDNPKVVATDLLTKKILLDQLALDMHLYVSDTYVQEKLRDQQFTSGYLSDIVPPFLYETNGILNSSLVRAFLHQRGMSSTAFIKKIKDGMARYTANALVAHTAYVPSYETDIFLTNTRGSKEVELLLLKEDAFIKKASLNLKPTVDELQHFFEEKNRTAQTYYVPEKRDVTVWTFSALNYGIPVSKEQIEEYYTVNKNKKYVAKQAQVTVRQIVYNNQPENTPSIAQLKEELTERPELFIEYAKKYSQDTGSASSGGLIEPLVYGTSNSQLYKAAFILKEVGDISPVIPFENRFVLLQLVKKEPRAFKPLSSVSGEIEQILQTQQFKQQFVQELKPILKDNVVDSTELANLVAVHKATRATLKDLVSTNPEKATKTAFSIAKEGLGSFFMDNDNGVVVVLNSIKTKFAPEFDSVKKTVESDWYALQGALELQKTYKYIQDGLPGKSLAAIAQELHIPLVNITINGKADKKGVKKLEEYGIYPADIMDIEKEGGFAYAMTRSGGYFARCIRNVNNTGTLLEANEKEALERETSQSIVEGLIASLYRGAKIETNETFTLPIEDYLV